MKHQFNLLHLLVFLAYLFAITNVTASENVKKSINDDNDEDEREEAMDIPLENENTNKLACSRRVNSVMHEIRPAVTKQFPFVAAIMSHQNEYLCAGSVVSNGLILTTASCTQQPVSYILLNTTRDKKDEFTTLLHVIKTEKFPTFTGSDSLKDVGVIYTAKHSSSIASKIHLSRYTTARDLVDIEAIGFGLNTEVGQVKPMQYIGMELRSPLESEDVLRAYFDCVDTKVPTCFKDTGGPVIFDNELVGIVIHGQEDCTKEMSATYAINKKMADILPTFTFKAWLDERIKKNEVAENTELPVFPIQPAAMRAEPPKPKKKLTAIVNKRAKISKGSDLKSSMQLLLVFYPILARFREF